MEHIIEYQHFVAKIGKDEFALRIGIDERGIIIRNCIIDGALGDWGMKGSKAFDATFEDCIFKNGAERALDMVRGGNIIFRRCKFVNDYKDSAGTKTRVRVKSAFWNLDKFCDIGLKAGIRDVTFEDCEMNDLLLGDYSIYDQIDRPKVRRIKLVNCKNPNRGPIFIRGRYVEKDGVILQNTNASVFIWPAFITWFYWKYNRKFGDRRPLNEEQRTITEEEKI